MCAGSGQENAGKGRPAEGAGQRGDAGCRGSGGAGNGVRPPCSAAQGAAVLRSDQAVLQVGCALGVPPVSILCDASKASLHRRDCGTASAYCKSVVGAPNLMAHSACDSQGSCTADGDASPNVADDHRAVLSAHKRQPGIARVRRLESSQSDAHPGVFSRLNAFSVIRVL